MKILNGGGVQFEVVAAFYSASKSLDDFKINQMADYKPKVFTKNASRKNACVLLKQSDDKPDLSGRAGFHTDPPLSFRKQASLALARRARDDRG